MPSRTERRRPWFSILFAAFLLLLAFTPILLTAVAASVANAFDCRLDEAGFYPCIIGGHDYGQLLGTMAMGVWLFLISQPLAVGIALLWLVFLALKRAVSRYKKGGKHPEPLG